jgi:hypothetical protein
MPDASLFATGYLRGPAGVQYAPLTAGELTTVKAARRTGDVATLNAAASAPSGPEAAALALCYEALLLQGKEPLDILLGHINGGYSSN